MVSIDLSREELLKEARDYLTQQTAGFLASTGSAGLRVSPVSIFIDSEMGIYLHCFGGDKLINLRENPEACLLVIEEKWTLDPGIFAGVQLFGKAYEISPFSDKYLEAEKWCPYTHKADMTLLELSLDKIVLVDYVGENKSKRKRSIELEALKT